MATTTRLGITLLEVGQTSKETVIDNALNSIDAAIAGLSLTNAFTGANSFSNTSTFTGASKFSGAVGGSGTLLPLKEVTISFATDGDYTLGTTVATEVEGVFIIISNGVITVQRNLIVPATTGGLLVITNNNTFGVQVKTAAGTGIVVASNRRAILKSGTNVTRITADTAVTP